MTTPEIDNVGLEGTSGRLVLVNFGGGKRYPEIVESSYTSIDIEGARDEEASLHEVFEILTDKFLVFWW